MQGIGTNWFTWVLIILLTLPVVAEEEILNEEAKGETFEELGGAQQLVGPLTTGEDLHGRAVLLFYWGVRCPVCQKILPEIIKLHKKYAKDRKLAVIGAHMQEASPLVKAYLQSKAANFPVFQQFNSKQAPCPQGLPAAVLFDHEGKVVKKGSPQDILKEVSKTLRTTPKPSHPIIGDIEVKFWKKYTDEMCEGKNVSKNITSLERAGEKSGPKAEEAGAIAKKAFGYLKEKQISLLEYATESPSMAQAELVEFLPWVKGLDTLEDGVKDRIKELSSDASLRALLKVQKDYQKVSEKALKGSGSVDRDLDKIRKALEKLIESEKTSEPVLNEAKSMLKELER